MRKLTVPEAFAPFARLFGLRPSIAPGEWPLETYAGRLTTIGERLSITQLPRIED